MVARLCESKKVCGAADTQLQVQSPTSHIISLKSISRSFFFFFLQELTTAENLNSSARMRVNKLMRVVQTFYNIWRLKNIGIIKLLNKFTIYRSKSKPLWVIDGKYRHFLALFPVDMPRLYLFSCNIKFVLAGLVQCVFLFLLGRSSMLSWTRSTMANLRTAPPQTS